MPEPGNRGKELQARRQPLRLAFQIEFLVEFSLVCQRPFLIIVGAIVVSHAGVRSIVQPFFFIFLGIVRRRAVAQLQGRDLPVGFRVGFKVIEELFHDGPGPAVSIAGFRVAGERQHPAQCQGVE